MASFSDPVLDQLLRKILEIIHYTDSRETFIQQFTQLCLDEALLDAIEALPHTQQEELKNRLTNKSTSESIEIMKDFITPSVYQTTYIQSRTKVFQDYIKTILPTVSPQQKQQLQEYLASVAANTK